MTVHLLDANVLIALTVAEHEHHGRVARWVNQADRLAVCPVTEGALLRYLLRVGERLAIATAVLAAVRSMARVDFWPDAISYLACDLEHVRGHGEVTDAYLAALVRSQPGARLATLDVGLATSAPDVVDLIA